MSVVIIVERRVIHFFSNALKFVSAQNFIGLYIALDPLLHRLPARVWECQVPFPFPFQQLSHFNRYCTWLAKQIVRMQTNKLISMPFCSSVPLQKKDNGSAIAIIVRRPIACRVFIVHEIVSSRLIYLCDVWSDYSIESQEASQQHRTFRGRRMQMPALSPTLQY